MPTHQTNILIIKYSVPALDRTALYFYLIHEQKNDFKLQLQMYSMH